MMRSMVSAAIPPTQTYVSVLKYCCFGAITEAK
jgi:hypothetical protein